MAKSKKPAPAVVEPPPEKWEIHLEEVTPCVVWFPNGSGKPYCTEEEKEAFLKLMCEICQAWEDEPDALVVDICKVVGLKPSAYFKYMRKNPKVADHIHSIKQVVFDEMFKNAFNIMGKVLRESETYKESTVIDYIKLLFSHNSARNFGFKKDVDIKTIVITDQTKPFPNYSKEEMDKT